MTIWLIYFEDKSVNPEVFTGEGAEAAARHRFKVLLGNWSCHLFRSVSEDDDISKITRQLEDAKASLALMTAARDLFFKRATEFQAIAEQQRSLE